MNKLYSINSNKKETVLEWSSGFGLSVFMFEDKENPEDSSGYKIDKNGNRVYVHGIAAASQKRAVADLVVLGSLEDRDDVVPHRRKLAIILVPLHLVREIDSLRDIDAADLVADGRHVLRAIGAI